MKTITFGEIISFLLPGGAVILGMSLVYPGLREQIASGEITVATVATFLILAYAMGHIVQTFGEVIGRIYWRMRGGFPTNWIRKGGRTFLSGAQMAAIEAQLSPKLRLKAGKSLSELSAEDWHSTVQQMCAVIAAKGRAARLDIYTGNLLLNRGMAAACLMLTGMAIEQLVVAGFMDTVLPYSWNMPVITATATCIFIYRMGQYGKRYAKEMFVQFIQLPGPSGGGN